MSVEALTAALNHAPSGITSTDRLVLIGIANHDGDNGSWPSIARLSRYAGVSERSVIRAIRNLEAAGLITTEIQMGGVSDLRADRRPNRYTLHLECPDECDRSMNHRMPGDHGYKPRHNGVTSVSPRDSNGVTSVVERGDIRGSHGVTRVSPEPNKEPPKEPTTPSLRSGVGTPTDEAATKTTTRSTRLPADWTPDPKTRAFLLERYPDMPSTWWRDETEKFADHFRSAPGQRGLKTDWEAAFRNWIRKAAEERPRRGLSVVQGGSDGGFRLSPADDRVMRGAALAAAFAPHPTHPDGGSPLAIERENPTWR